MENQHSDIQVRPDPWDNWQKAVTPKSGLAAKLKDETGVNPGLCFSCRKCTNGCPLADEMDLEPWQIINNILNGREGELVGCKTIWLCASCQTCLTRCPNGIDIPRLMDGLKGHSMAEGSVAEERTALFHQLFLNEVKKRGRVFEAGMMARYILKTDGPFSEAAARQRNLGIKMIKRGRIKVLPKGIKDRAFLKELFGGRS